MPVVFWISFGVLWGVVLVQGFAFLEVLRQIGLIRQQLEPMQGAAVIGGAVTEGAPLPELEGFGAGDGSPAHWDQYLTTKHGVAVFLTAHCVTCRDIAEKLTGYSRDAPADVSVIVVIQGAASEVESFIESTKLDRRISVIDPQAKTSRSIGISWNPAALTIHDRRLGQAAITNNIFQIDAFIQNALDQRTKDPSEAMQLA